MISPLFISIIMLANAVNVHAELTDTYADIEPDTQIQNMPLPAFENIHNVRQKKDAFFSFLSPLIREANKEVMAERRALKQIQTQLQRQKQKPNQPLVKLSQEEVYFVAQMAEKYRIGGNNTEIKIKRLLQRIGRIPVSLAMVQAANESAWGTSRFAQEGNNLFGQWCFDEGCGLIPTRRGDSSNHEVASFATPYESVRAYVLNLNRHAEYEVFRQLRRSEVDLQGYPTGMTLVNGLSGYSQRGDDYVGELQNMIRFNNLQRFDNGGNPTP